MAIGLHSTIKMEELRSALLTDESHSSPAAILSVSDERKTVGWPRKSSVIRSFSREATAASSVIWLMKI
jgi:hypothetical protein